MHKIAFVLVTGVVLACTGSSWGADAAKGKVIYEKKCAMCHGKDLKGAPAMTKALKVDLAKLSLLTDEVQKSSDEELIKVTTEGEGKMPAYKGKLTEAEIQDSIAYIRSLAPAKE